MSAPQDGRYDSIARRWLALVERRQAHFLELCDTGRWRHYYTHAEFLDEMGKVLRVRDQWAAIAGLPLSDEEELRHKKILSRGSAYSSPRADKPPVGMAAPQWPD
jgi:uncharacterized repeat protein (TIGR03809 family)